MCAFEYYSYEDYKHWQGDWELIDGIAYAMAPSPVFNHQVFAYEIAFRFRTAFDKCGCIVLGEEDYKIDEYNVVKPDVVVVCEMFERYITKAPKIIVEVVSPSTAKRDEKIKFEIYEKEKVDYYVLFYPNDKMVKVYKHNGEKFDKLKDSDEYEFEIEDCKGKVNFKAIFERFKGL